jgi:hypothetical protein
MEVIKLGRHENGHQYEENGHLRILFYLTLIMTR